ncbi:hypothetical protein [Pantoea piersonii]|uniref:hypothetical protein n=1 Tax=Pantoea piersonii TaxID=2364647 RepID=UPI0022F1821C|nr:hypothetical protein [Pantoea piersonii]WBV22749.1 hypothetical protein PG877_06235 [Pantoea piersonii]
MGQRKDYNQRASQYLNADAASCISAIRSDLNKVDNTNTQEATNVAEKAREKLIPCPRLMDGTPLIEYAPGYLIHQDNFEDYVSGERKLPDEQREQVDAASITESWEWFVVKWRTAWTLENWNFNAWPCTLADDPRQVHHP